MSIFDRYDELPIHTNEELSGLRAEVVSLQKENASLKARLNECVGGTKRDLAKKLEQQQEKNARLTQQLAAANGRADRDREWVCALEVRLIEIAGYHPAAMQGHAISSLCSRVSKKKWELLRESAALSDLPQEGILDE